jgi:hypothetical protein
MSQRRMTKHLSLVLLTSLPGLSGCGGSAAPLEKTEEIEEWVAEPPPEGPEHILGAPFVVWWDMSHPPTLIRRTVPVAAAALAAGRSSYSRPYYSRPYYGGRSSFLGSGFAGSSSHPAPPAHSSSISRGGFGSTGHASSGSSGS